MAGVIKLESDPRITVLALSWRDIKAPKAGGAEIHTHEMLSRADHKKIMQEWMNDAIWIYNRKLCGGFLESSSIYAADRKVKTKYNNTDTERDSVSNGDT